MNFLLFLRRCEVRPGPEFLVRRYEFGRPENGSSPFVLRQFHYGDRDCGRKPLFAVTAWGAVRLRQKSWAVPGATEVGVTLHKVSLVPYTESAGRQLEKT